MVRLWPTAVVCVLLVSIIDDQCVAQEPRVAGLKELLVVEPSVQQEGLPSALVSNEGGALSVDIPPTLHIHRMFYSGDREFQGPIVKGGPVVVVANHPTSGERLYTELTLPPGAPIISYDQRGISYVYDQSRIVVDFGRRSDCVVKIRYLDGHGLKRNASSAAQAIGKTMQDKIKSAELTTALGEGVQDGAALAKGVLDGADHLVSGVLSRMKAAIGVIPGIAALKGYGEDAKLHDYWNEIDTARRQKDRAETLFVPTNR